VFRLAGGEGRVVEAGKEEEDKDDDSSDDNEPNKGTEGEGTAPVTVVISFDKLYGIRDIVFWSILSKI